MSPTFWIKRFFVVLLGAFVIISLAQGLKGRPWLDAIREGAIWGPITAVIFTVARIIQARRGQHCAICKDTPEMQSAQEDES